MFERKRLRGMANSASSRSRSLLVTFHVSTSAQH